MRYPTLRVLAIVSFAVVWIAGSGCGDSAEPKVSFGSYDQTAFDAARAEGKPIVVFATADWCPPCKALKKGALSDDTVKSALDPFTRLKLDFTQRGDSTVQQIGRELRIDGIPVLIFFDRNGDEVARLGGARPAQAIIAAAKKAASP